MKKVNNGFMKSTLALGIVAALSMGITSSVNAVSFNWGEVDGTFDSTWSAGASWRVEGRDWDNHIGKVNHPQFDWSGYSAFGDTKYTSDQIWAQPGSYSSNGDLSNLLYSQGDTTAVVFKGLHELSLKYKNFGVFARGMYFYDQKANNGSYGFSDPLTGKKYDPCADSKASEVQCKDIRLLDAFVYGDFDFNDGANPLTVRVGQQVVSWGESTLIPHGIGVINAVDLNILNAPGSELKEAYRPQGMVWASFGVTNELSVEAFYQYDWEPVWVPTPGSYFSTNDFVGYGGYGQNAQLGFQSNPDMNLEFIEGEYNNLAQLVAAGMFDTNGELDINKFRDAALAYSTKATLVQDQASASDSGQYGLKLGYYAPQLGETEFGLYYMNYHSRRPLISGTTANYTNEALLRDGETLRGAVGAVDRATLLSLESFSKAQIEYPEERRKLSTQKTFSSMDLASTRLSVIRRWRVR